ncbi:Cof-type HAD-IIB family hydrolase [Paenibacillus sp. HB172176]|uniref:Cof-type HAD-IIB family hydrolase n=1 Tax=Paenibacillus sp. HB172176 TaxID=2493690 RepID=UPI00143C0D4E|nr:Cof-type HAD-IIB family hydrolase [Paenibacillus sp. HB172176]
MTTYKLIALDMDGTLLNDRQEVSPQNQEWISRAMEAGLTVILSTGRGFDSASPYAEQLKLEGPMITVNGGEVWAKPNLLHKRTELSWTYVKRLRELALQHEEPWYWAYSTYGVFNKEQWIDPAEAYDQHHWLKFGYYTENDEIRAELLAEARSWGAFEITNSSPTNLELNPLGISKASGLEEVCGLLGIAMSEVVAVGDSLNDIAAIRAAGLGVAMGNAQEEVKQAADFVTLTNEENGVAEVIKRCLKLS